MVDERCEQRGDSRFWATFFADLLISSRVESGLLARSSTTMDKIDDENSGTGKNRLRVSSRA